MAFPDKTIYFIFGYYHGAFRFREAKAADETSVLIKDIVINPALIIFFVGAKINPPGIVD